MTLAKPRRAELGDISQLASGRQVRLDDGSEVGVRAVDVRVAGGIHALVLVDRGLDLGPAWVGGFPISWQSSTGIVHPSFFRDDAWLRSFHGGLLFTAGLQNVGSPSQEGDEEHGLHGRLSNLPARNVCVETIEDGDGLAVVVRGEVRETTVYGVDLLLRRTLRFPAWEPVIELSDEVVNLGFAPAPVLILYHVNLGHPVVDAGSRLFSPAKAVAGWDDPSREAEAEHAQFVPPTPGFPVQVFEHLIPDDAPQRVAVGVMNEGYEPSGGIGVAIEYDRAALPRLWQWRMLSQGLYVTGIEPANCGLLGRAAERESGSLKELEPGGTMQFGVRIRAAVGQRVAALASAA
ncbi:MAG: aldose 1-epimerase family protein [Chloroflexi bacterium]|nr:aldose 1-epimerase family protein [Chloroflexota bacterium]